MIGFGILLGLIPLLFATFFGRQNSAVNTSTASSANDSVFDWHRNVTALSLPSEVFLFDKKLPLENWEVRERFEREFYYNYTNADQLLIWWKRLKRWESMIDSMLDANKLPRDFKYLMIAESGARNVQSPARANGYWQFIAPTAERFGLRVDQSIDERLDPILSTTAAMVFLSRLKAQFNSNYFLSAAAYNMGEEGLQLAMDFQHQSNYWNLNLSEETMRYLLRIAVIKELMEQGQKYGFHFALTTPYKMHSLKTVSVHGPIINISDWAISQGFTYKDVKFYNPRFIAHSIPVGVFDIRLPATDSDRTTVK